MRKEKVGLYLLIFLVSSLPVSADITEGEIIFADDYDTESTPNDAMTWLNTDIVSYMEYISGLMVVCWDWNGDGVYSRCVGAAPQAFDACMWSYPELENICNTAECIVGNVVGNQDLWEKRSELCPGHESTCPGVVENMKVKYYVDCDLPTKARGTPTNNGEQYYILSYRHYACDPVEGPYDDEVYYGNWKVWQNGISCGSGYGCDERLDGGNAKFGYYGTSVPSVPCSKQDGQSCSSNDECLNDHCSIYNICDESCGDGYCDKASSEWCIIDPCIPSGTCGHNPEYCNTCGSNQCASDHWYGEGASKYCFNRGELCCSGDPVFGQYYCKTNDAWAECSSSYHYGCQQQGSYYCTYEGGTWRWRNCPYGCNTGTNKCYTPIVEPDINVSPSSLMFEIGY